MATVIAQCKSCHQMIYWEDHIAGACSCPEGSLRQLLAQKQRRPATMARTASQAPVRQQLPDLTPEMLLSSSALREMRAAEGHTHRMPAPRPPRNEDRNAYRREYAASFDSEDEPAEDPAASLGSLEDIWGGAVARDTGRRGSLDIDFSTGELDYEPPVQQARPSGMGAASLPRFNVTRPPVDQTAFRRELVGANMREIGRTRNGQVIFSDRSTRSVDEPAPRPSFIEHTSRTVPASQANARTAAIRAAEHAKLPTAFEVLQRPFLEDDD